MNQQRVVVISGGLGGVGRAVGHELAEDGFDIVALYLNTAPREAEEILKHFPAGNHHAIHCDIRDEHAVQETFDDISVTYGEIYGVIHAAVDPILRKNILELNKREIEDQMGTGFFGGFNFIKTAAMIMKKNNEGRIVGILSRPLVAKIPHKRMAGYIIGKHALRGLLSELALELGGGNITVNAVAPDFLDTDLNADLPERVRDFIKERAVTGNMKTPEDVAHAVSFLCSKEGENIRGKIFSFDMSEMRDL